VADNEILLDRKKSAEVEEVKAKKKPDGASLPLLVEFTITLCIIIVVIVFLTIVVNSILTGVTLLDFVFHTSVSILVIGGLLTLIARQITSGMLSASTLVEEPSEELEISDLPEVN
jgi:hypothetical protein